MYNGAGAVGYLLKYISKGGLRTPVGKREVFHSQNIGQIKSKVFTYKQAKKLVDKLELIDIKYNTYIFKLSIDKN